MPVWSLSNTISREEAIRKIEAEAREKGYNTWKVYYDDDLVETPEDMPDQVDYNLIRISAVLNQA